MERTNPVIPALVSILAVGSLAGCMEETSLMPDAELTYDGRGDGTHSETADCGAEGVLEGTGQVDDGEVVLTVVDGDGTELYTETYSGSIALSDTTLEGDSGDWRIHAERSGNDLAGDEFLGDYEFTLDC